MSRIKKRPYSPNTVILDLKNQADAEKMLKIAKSIKGAKVEVMKKEKIAMIRYPEIKGHFYINFRQKLTNSLWVNLEEQIAQLTAKGQNLQQDEDENTSDTRLYNAMILK